MNENNNPLGQSFDAIVASIQKKNEKAPTSTAPTEAPVQPTSTQATPVETPVQPAPAEAPTPKPVAKMTFEELVAQAKAAAGMPASTSAEAPVTAKEPAQEAKEDTPVETPVTPKEPAQPAEITPETAPVETPVETETVAPETAPVETPVETVDVQPTETIATEEPAKKTEEAIAPAEDETDDYRVDLSMANADTPPVMNDVPVEEPAEEPVVEEAPKKKKKKSKAKTKVETVVTTETTVEEAVTPSTDVQETTKVQVVERAEAVFGEKEVAEMRTILRSWLRHELKLAMVEAMKDITRDFNV